MAPCCTGPCPTCSTPRPVLNNDGLRIKRRLCSYIHQDQNESIAHRRRFVSFLNISWMREFPGLCARYFRARADRGAACDDRGHAIGRHRLRILPVCAYTCVTNSIIVYTRDWQLNVGVCVCPRPRHASTTGLLLDSALGEELIRRHIRCMRTHI